MTASHDSTRLRMLRRPALLVAAATAVGLLATACGTSAGGSGSAPARPASATAAAAHSTALVKTSSGRAGTLLTDGAGRTLYMFASDTAGKPTCTGACSTYWPPLLAKGKLTAAGSAKAADLGTVSGSGRTKQVTYGGHPLYYYVGDHAPGDTTGQGLNIFGGKWWLLAPSGNPITGSGSSGASSGGYGGYGR